RVVELADDNDVLAVGPGLGRGPQINAVIATLLAQVRKPTVLDADGLNAVAGPGPGLPDHAMPLIVTPHPGGFARLLGTDTRAVQAHRSELAARFAAENRVV